MEIKERGSDGPSVWRGWYHYAIPVVMVALAWEINAHNFAHWHGQRLFPEVQPVVTILGFDVFNPWIYLAWATKALTQLVYLDEFVESGVPGFTLAALAAVYYVFGSFMRKRSSKDGFHGSARFATRRDLVRGGLITKSGTGWVLGQTQDAILVGNVDQTTGKRSVRTVRKGTIVRAPRDTNAMIFAAPRTGKTISTVATSIIDWPDHLVINDPKSELWDMTAGFKELMSNVWRVDPTRRGYQRYNPVWDIRGGEKAFRDASMIAAEYIDTDSPAGGDSGATLHFNERAKDCFTAVLLHVAFSVNVPAHRKSIPGALAFLSGIGISAVEDDKAVGADKAIKAMLAGQYGDPAIPHHIQAALGRVLSMPEKERGSMFSTIFRAISVFEDPVLAELSSVSDFTIDEFLTATTPITLYLTTPASDAKRLAPYVRSIYAMLIDRVSAVGIVNKKKPVQRDIGCVLEEFPHMGKFSLLKDRAGLIPGMGISFLFVAQGNSQLMEIYGQNHSLFDVCPTWVTFATPDIKLAELVSKIGGVQSKLNSTHGVSGQFAIQSQSENTSDQKRDLITADEVVHLHPDAALAVSQGIHLAPLSKIYSYSDDRYASYMNIAPPAPQDQDPGMGARKPAWAYMDNPDWFQPGRSDEDELREAEANTLAEQEMVAAEEAEIRTHVRHEDSVADLIRNPKKNDESESGDDDLAAYKNLSIFTGGDQ